MGAAATPLEAKMAAMGLEAPRKEGTKEEDGLKLKLYNFKVKARGWKTSDPVPLGLPYRLDHKDQDQARSVTTMSKPESTTIFKAEENVKDEVRTQTLVC
jgi:hypothetical protein